MISRERKILRISQAHVASGMNLTLWREILKGHKVNLSAKDPWPAVKNRTIDAIFDEIAGIVKAARGTSAALPQMDVAAATSILSKSEGTFDPVDLYWPGEGTWEEVESKLEQRGALPAACFEVKRVF